MLCERAIELAPDFAIARFGRSLALLTMGQFAEGWAEYEWRWQRKGHEEPVLEQPRWSGEPLEGRTILVRCEQGFGDTMQFARYAEPLKQRGACVVLESQGPLVELMASCVGVDRVIARGQSPSTFDFHIPLLSLPAIFQTTLESIPAKTPYLSPDAQLCEEWKEKLGSGEAFRIGIAWKGHPANKRDQARSIPLTQFRGIAGDPRVHVYSLQMDEGREQLAALANLWPMTDLGDRPGGFHHTAAIMRNLDLVITCDSAPAHLAGALGVPVWVALPFAPDWRWMLARENSPWYPTMRLFRQSQRGDWDDVFRRMEAELTKIV